MYESFDAFEYLDYLRRRWRVLAVACGVALALSLAISLLLPKRYTATASIVIEPPGSTDVRTAIAVSPVYLESLKTYERFAGSDSLFARAANKFHLQEGGSSQSIESLKGRVLKVSKLRDTKILEIRATLQDARLAQGMVQYLAEETVSMNRDANLAGDREFIGDAQTQVADAQLHLDELQKALTNQISRAPVEALQTEIDATAEFESKVRQQLVDAEGDIAEYQQHSEGQFAREQLQAARARAALLEKRSQELQGTIQEKGALLAARIAKRDELQTQLQTAQSAYESAVARLRDLRAAVGTHGERLRVVDPGIVPERPSSPNIILNVGAALFLAVVLSILYLSFAFVFRRKAIGFEPAVTRGMRA